MERLIRRVLPPLPGSVALAGVVIAGIGWSLSAGWARWDEVQGSGLGISQVLPPLLAGGMATVLALWFAIGAVLWAMCRVCGQHAGFRTVLMVLSGAGIAMTLVTPAAAFHLAGGAPLSLWFLFALGAAVSCLQVVASLTEAAAMPQAKAWASLILTGVFCASFVSLYQ